MIRIALVDDHDLLRAGVRAILEKDPQFQIVGETGDGQDAIRRIAEWKPDIVLMDVHLPGGIGGLDATEAIAKDHPEAKVIILTQYDNREYIRRALRIFPAYYLWLGVFVVLRGMSYIGHGLSHAVFGGAAASAVMNLNYFLGAGVWGVWSGVLIGRISRRRIIGADAAIGVVTTASFALGLALLNRYGQAKKSIEAVLFGSVLGVKNGDIVAVTVEQKGGSPDGSPTTDPIITILFNIPVFFAINYTSIFPVRATLTHLSRGNRIISTSS